MNIEPQRILIIYDNRSAPDKFRQTILQHLHCLEASKTKHKLYYYNSYDSLKTFSIREKAVPPPAWIFAQRFDIIILHYAFLTFRTTDAYFYKWKEDFSWIKDLDGLKIAIPQDEFDRAGVLDEWLYDWGISIIFSTQYTEARPLYPIMRQHAKIYSCLPGYIDEAQAQRLAAELTPPTERAIDIIYRANHLPYRFGSAGQRKHQIASVIAKRAKERGFKCDISTRPEDVILGQDWQRFISSGRAVIGGEGGSSVIDWRGEIKAQTVSLLRQNPNLSFAEASQQMPLGWDDYSFLTLTPRHFEAIISKTCQILVEGEYRGILKPDKHYIPLKKDFSNLDEALDKLKDDQLVEELVERAYQDIYLNGHYTYRHFAESIEKAIYEYKQNCPRQTESVINIMNKQTEQTEIVERQLIAERHKYALLEAQLTEKSIELGELNNQLATVRTKYELLSQQYADLQTQRQAEQNRWNVERQTMQNQWQAGQSQWQIEREAIRNHWANERASLLADRHAERVIVNAERKKWFILITIVISSLVLLTIILFTVMLFLPSNIGLG